jgi:hypothetical protein
VINIGTLVAVAIGFVLGWIWRGWREREKAGIKAEKPDDDK